MAKSQVDPACKHEVSRAYQSKDLSQRLQSFSWDSALGVRLGGSAGVRGRGGGSRSVGMFFHAFFWFGFGRVFSRTFSSVSGTTPGPLLAPFWNHFGTMLGTCLAQCRRCCLRKTWFYSCVAAHFSKVSIYLFICFPLADISKKKQCCMDGSSIFENSLENFVIFIIKMVMKWNCRRALVFSTDRRHRPQGLYNIFPSTRGALKPCETF